MEQWKEYELAARSCALIKVVNNGFGSPSMKLSSIFIFPEHGKKGCFSRHGVIFRKLERDGRRG